MGENSDLHTTFLLSTCFYMNGRSSTLEMAAALLQKPLGHHALFPPIEHIDAFGGFWHSEMYVNLADVMPFKPEQIVCSLPSISPGCNTGKAWVAVGGRIPDPHERLGWVAVWKFAGLSGIPSPLRHRRSAPTHPV